MAKLGDDILLWSYCGYTWGIFRVEAVEGDVVCLKKAISASLESLLRQEVGRGEMVRLSTLHKRGPIFWPYDYADLEEFEDSGGSIIEGEFFIEGAELEPGSWAGEGLFISTVRLWLREVEKGC